jgi:hypothetical protein
MSTTPTIRADVWLDQKLTAARRRLHQNRQRVSDAVARHPMCAVAAGVGFGYIARRLPLARLTAAAVRLSLGSLPHALLVVGAARTWQLLRTPPAPRVLGQDGAGWMPAEESIAMCNRLLAGEMNARSLCERALDQLPDEQPRADVQHVVAVHEDNAARLRDLIRAIGGEPAAEFQPPAFGPVPAVAWDTLQEMELCNLRQIEEALSNLHLVEDIQQLLLHHLLPRTKENMATLLRAQNHPHVNR